MTKLMRAMVVMSLAAVAISCGVFVLEKNEAKPRAMSHAPLWPQDSSIALANRQRETVVAFVLPHCDCTAATVADVARMMKQHPKALAYLMFVRPQTEAEGWEVDEHWSTAAGIANAVVLPDPGGLEQARFGARSGDVFVYDATGALEAGGVQVASR
jgi:hypothetical protein